MHSSDVYLPLQYKDEDKNIATGDIILVGSTGSELVIGKAAFISKVLENTQIGAFLRIVRPYCKEYAQYVAVIFKTTFYREYIRKKASGTNINNIKSGHLENFLIPVPPVTEQHRIVNSIAEKEQHFLVIQSSRIRYKHILSGTPTSLRQQLIQAAIQGQLVPQNPNDEPASALLERIAQERSAKLGKKVAKSMSRIERRGSKTHSTYHEIFADGSEKEISEEIPFCIPDNWLWTRLGSIADVKGGKRIPSGMHTTSEKTAHIYIRVADMIKGSISDNNLVYISDDVFQKISRYTISKDDLYLTIAGTIGKAGIVPDIFDGMNLTENAVKITNFSINKQFLLYLLISECCRSQFTAKTTCVAQPKLAIERILTTLLPIPPLKEQEKVCKTLQKCLELVDRSEQ